MTTPPFREQIPSILEDLGSVVAAIFTIDGGLVEANEGFHRLLDAEGEAGLEDPTTLFVQPPFKRLTQGAQDAGWALTYEGILNVGGQGREQATSLDGAVHRHGDHLVLFAEHDPEDHRKLQDRVLALHDDLTEAHRKMARELQARKQAEQRLAEKARSLEQSNEVLEDFASVVSHDLQEPLRMTESYLALLVEGHGEALDQEATEYVSYAMDGTRRMREMVQGLLEYSRVQAQGRDQEPVALEDVVEEVLGNLRVAIDEANAIVDVDTLGTVLGDGGQLMHVFQNLVDNAIKYSKERPRITIHAEPSKNGMICVHVEDNGEGIPKEEQADLFRIFRRGTHDNNVEGTGVGLAVCQRVIKRHGGTIEVDSTPGEGTTFSFTLPPIDEKSD